MGDGFVGGDVALVCVSNGFDLTDNLVFGVRLAFTGRHARYGSLTHSFLYTYR